MQIKASGHKAEKYIDEAINLYTKTSAEIHNENRLKATSIGTFL